LPGSEKVAAVLGILGSSEWSGNGV
jgi:hypothetical protein